MRLHDSQSGNLDDSRGADGARRGVIQIPCVGGHARWSQILGTLILQADIIAGSTAEAALEWLRSPAASALPSPCLVHCVRQVNNFLARGQPAQPSIRKTG
jgi:hypothetical protein